MREKPSPREVLSANMRALMAARPELGTIKKVADASGTALSNGKVGRIYAASHTTDIDTLQSLADVFGLEPWQLLVESLNPHALPRLADETVLHQILDAVSRRETTPVALPLTISGADQVKPEVGPEVPPALEKAFRVKGVGKREVGKPGGVQKPRGRRRA